MKFGVLFPEYDVFWLKNDEGEAMLKHEFQYYLDHQEELLKKYNGKVIVIIGERVIGAFNTKQEAYLNSIKKYEPGTFLIIECTPGKDSYTYHQRSRIISVI